MDIKAIGLEIDRLNTDKKLIVMVYHDDDYNETIRKEFHDRINNMPSYPPDHSFCKHLSPALNGNKKSKDVPKEAGGGILSGG